jgi:hypothetical protein
MDVCDCFLLSGGGLCDGPIPHPEESSLLWCVIVCDLETVPRWAVAPERNNKTWRTCELLRSKSGSDT